MGRAAGRRRGNAAGAGGLSDILAGQAVDATTLAGLYDLEHDEITEDLAFYATWAGRTGGSVLDLGCGSGRLFRPLLEGGAASVVGLDGSPALLERARVRIAADPVLIAAFDGGRLELGVGDVRTVARRDRFDLVVLAGVIAHLSGPEDALRALTRAGALLAPGGTVILDGLGPGALPPHDLPLSLDWEREIDGRRVVRRSSLVRRETPDGLHVDYRTLTDVTEADGTIARLPASFALWYPEVSVSVALAEEADLEVAAAFGSHEEDPLDGQSERTILVMRRSTPDRSTE